MIFVNCFLMTVFGLLLNTELFTHFLALVFWVLVFASCMLIIRAICGSAGGDD